MKVPGKVCVALKISFYADAFNQRYQTKQHPLSRFSRRMRTLIEVDDV